MATLSEARRTAIYGAVHEEIMQARIAVRKLQGISFVDREAVDSILSRAQDRAGQAAIKAATEYIPSGRKER